METQVSIFRNSQAARFRIAWAEFTKCRSIPDSETSASVWARKSGILQSTWKDLMQAILSRSTWLCLKLLLERREEFRSLWLKPGGYFLTRGGNLRKGTDEYLRRIKKKKRPIVTETMLDRLSMAEHLYSEALAENESLTDSNTGRDDLLVVTVALAGYIRGGAVDRKGLPLFHRVRRLPKEEVERLVTEWGLVVE